MKAAILSLLLTSILTSCDDFFDPCIEGNGNIITSQIEISPFQTLIHEGTWDVRIVRDSVQSVSVTGDENIIERIERDVDEGEWEIELEDDCYRAYQLEFEIKTPFLNFVNLNGSGDIEIEDVRIVQLRISGSGDIIIDGVPGDQDELYIALSGSGNYFALSNFDIRRLNISVSGSGDLELFPIQSDSCYINISGSGDAEVSVEDLLNCTISGSGDVLYKGYPVIQQDVSGSGNLIDAN